MPTTYQPGAQIDHYSITEILHQGGDCSVYHALDQLSGQQVVLKFPHIEEIGGRDILLRYRRTRAIGKHLYLPGIQNLMNFDENRSEEYLVLEYLDGQTLREVLHQQPVFPVDEALNIMLPIVETLVSLHAQGVIHRDIKPENIILRSDGRVALFDFGIAQWEGERHLRYNGYSKLIGTPAYMAPELLQGQQGSVATDIYAVGVVLYELLCGHTPFQDHDFDLLSQHISHDPPSLLAMNPEVPPSLATVVMRAIRRQPQKRYLSMQALAKDLAHLDQVSPEIYLPDRPLFGGRYRRLIQQSFSVALVISLIGLGIVGLGLLAQFAHAAHH